MKNSPTLALAALLASVAPAALAATYTSANYVDTNGGHTAIGGSLEVLPGGSMVVDAGGSFTMPAGGGTGAFQPAGRLYSSFSASGVGNAADTSDDVLFSYTLPASSFNANGQFLQVNCFGGTAADGNNKTIKLWFGSEVISSGVVTDSNKNWTTSLIVGRTGASAQLVRGTMTHDTASITPYLATGAEADTGPVTIKCTGASGTTGAAGDVVGRGMTVESFN